MEGVARGRAEVAGCGPLSASSVRAVVHTGSVSGTEVDAQLRRCLSLPALIVLSLPTIWPSS